MNDIADLSIQTGLSRGLQHEEDQKRESVLVVGET